MRIASAAAAALFTALLAAPVHAQKNAPNIDDAEIRARNAKRSKTAKEAKAKAKAKADPGAEGKPAGQPAAAAEGGVPHPHQHKGPAGCQFYGELACAECLAYWAAQGDGRNNHMCKDKSRANGTKGWDCFNYAEDTSHGYECISYCPPETPTCKSNCDQRKPDGSPWHDHPLRETRNKNNGRILGPPGSAPERNKGLESREQCVW